MINPVDFIHEETNLAKHVTNALGYAQPMVLPFMTSPWTRPLQ